MKSQLKSINLGSPLLRVLLAAPVALALISSWYVVRWYVGGTMAEYAPNIEEGGLDTATAAVNLAPDDPLTHFVLADIETNTISPDKGTDAIKQYEEAVRLSPNDYRLWMALGHSLESAGDRSGAESSLHRAVDLAPFYAYPRWYLGNFLIREGRLEEGFAELEVAGNADPSLRPQIFRIASQAYPGSVGWLKKTVGRSTGGKAALAGFLLAHDRSAEGLQIWSDFTSDEKKEQQSTGESLVGSLIAGKHYRAALELFRVIKGEEAALPAVGQIFNGGFETDPDHSLPNAFDWQLKSTSLAQVAYDLPNRHAGARSLRIVFNARTTFNFNQVSQLVVVQPSTSYRLEFYVRSQSLLSAETPRIEIVDGTDGHSILGLSQPVSSGDSDWQPVTVVFKTPPTTEGVFVRIARAACEGEAGCPIYGTVWYDDFNLQRAGAGSNAGPAETGPARSSAKAGNSR